MMIRLTPQQQAVVAHTYGPALVFAVAGAGKTTALEARIVRLVRERVFAPERILAAAYNTAVKAELSARLRGQRGCRAVEVVTLHALGLRAIRMAFDAGLLPHLQRRAFQAIETAQETLLNAALVEARQRKVPYLRELDGLDRADFLTWVGNCKGNLLYPDLAAQPAIIRKSRHAQQAAAPPQTEWYLPFAQLLEEVQRAHGLLTFDDQLRVGWEVLVSHHALLTRLQQSYDCVMVDEFQDVNLAQFLILDLITAPRPDKPQRNYMVVGDDDQTIYEWRGANPHFILNFAATYGAASYVMDENFRSPAGPLALANQVIRHNEQRHPKTLRLTQGMDGETVVTRCQDRRQMGQNIVATIRAHIQRGDTLPEMAVLVRAKAQTPPVELALIQAQLPYEVMGSEPFYARWEIVTLVSYCRLALFEQQLQQGKQLTAAEASQLAESWDAVYRHPKRYISAREAQQIGAELARGRAPITQVLRATVIADKPHVQARLGEMATLLQWLGGAFTGGKLGPRPAYAVLQELERKLGYCAYLEGRGTHSEAGVDEAENVRQFIEEAKGRGPLRDYLVYLKQLAAQQAAQQAAAQGNLLTIRTIHSAKGLEWPVVMIPSCDDGNIPHRQSDNLEEERRLLYVALTRTRRDLYIYHLAAQPSPFLRQAKWQIVLAAVHEIQAALAKPPATWSENELRAVAIAAPQLGLLDYFQAWHKWGVGEQTAVMQAVSTFLEEAAASRVGRGDKASLAQLAQAWRALAQGNGAASSSISFDPGVMQNRARPPAARPAKVLEAAASRPAHAPYAWEAFDEIEHPAYGRGIVISTTTTTRGRELKVQFVDGNLRHFRDDDPALARG